MKVPVATWPVAHLGKILGGWELSQVKGAA